MWHICGCFMTQSLHLGQFVYVCCAERPAERTYVESNNKIILNLVLLHKITYYVSKIPQILGPPPPGANNFLPSLSL